MVNEVGVRLGVFPPNRIEESMTFEQIELQFYWSRREQLRQMKISEAVMTRAVARAFTGSE